MFLTCERTVSGESTSSSAISSVVRVALSRSMTSHSRAVSGLLTGRMPDEPLGASRSRSISASVILREIAACPSRRPASARGSASISRSLERKPLAPARSACMPSS